MASNKFGSPTLNLHIGDEQMENAVRSKSGGCLISDAIKSQYPQFSRVTTDMATIRFTDRKAGKRYTYLTPPDAQHLLLSFDQGWPAPTEDLVLKRAVKVDPMRREKTGRNSIAGRAEKRAERKAELEAKRDRGEELTNREKASLTRVTNPKPAPERPTSGGPVEVKTDPSGAVVHGGNRLRVGKAHPNLLRGSDRHFGAKLADPGEAFKEAVEAAVSERLAQEPVGAATSGT